MTAEGTPGSRDTGTGPEDAAAARLAAVACELGEAAGAVRAAGLAVTAVATDPTLLASLGRSPRRGLRAAQALAHGLTDAAGLGYAPDGGRAGRVARLAGAAALRRSLAADLAATALRLRIRLCATRHAEYATQSPVRRLLVAVEAGLPELALRILRERVRVRGAGHTLAALAPALGDVSAWSALTDGNPFNDAAAWRAVMGTAAGAASVPGPRAEARPGFLRSREKAVAEPPDPAFLDGLDDGGGITAHLRNMAALGHGRMLTRHVTGPDGAARCLVLLPGPGFVLPRTASPQELVGAVAELNRGDSPYTRAVREALLRTVPEGMPVALVGHGHGGVTAGHLACAPEAGTRLRITHVVAIGSPAGPPRPHDPRTRVVALAEEHDLTPRLGGHSPVPALPPPPALLEITWADPSYDVPQCHGAETYAQSLDKTAPEARDRVDELLAPYRGRAGRTVVHRLPAG
ncbi:hypothetical protein FGW37_04945 [Streptomyces rectiverticillatus]|uniref:hypothetical protein n=1 Tax=Streptomyces rectiverticillatus TaxID=173860 RepID=UPI0015C31D4B|nr:hypothetical protein [Streptomyces rectiverticillatus]QLE71037.1 hypothetical protein FGW37_04945 [Streptomyces rectiverticillatus]